MGKSLRVEGSGAGALQAHHPLAVRRLQVAGGYVPEISPDGLGNIGGGQAQPLETVGEKSYLQLRVGDADVSYLVHALDTFKVFFTKRVWRLRFSSSPALVTTTMALGNALEVLTSYTNGSSASSGNSSV